MSSTEQLPIIIIEEHTQINIVNSSINTEFFQTNILPMLPQHLQSRFQNISQARASSQNNTSSNVIQQFNLRNTHHHTVPSTTSQQEIVPQYRSTINRFPVVNNVPSIPDVVIYYSNVNINDVPHDHCLICMMSWNTTGRKPVEMNCHCKQIICLECFLKSFNLNKKCPFCRHTF